MPVHDRCQPYLLQEVLVGWDQALHHFRGADVLLARQLNKSDRPYKPKQVSTDYASVATRADTSTLEVSMGCSTIRFCTPASNDYRPNMFEQLSRGSKVVMYKARH